MLNLLKHCRLQAKEIIVKSQPKRQGIGLETLLARNPIQALRFMDFGKGIWCEIQLLSLGAIIAPNVICHTITAPPLLKKKIITYYSVVVGTKIIKSNGSHLGHLH